MVTVMELLRVENFLIGKCKIFNVSFFKVEAPTQLKLTDILFHSEPLQGLFVPFKKVVMAWTG